MWAPRRRNTDLGPKGFLRQKDQRDVLRIIVGHSICPPPPPTTPPAPSPPPPPARRTKRGGVGLGNGPLCPPTPTPFFWPGTSERKAAAWQCEGTPAAAHKDDSHLRPTAVHRHCSASEGAVIGCLVRPPPPSPRPRGLGLHSARPLSRWGNPRCHGRWADRDLHRRSVGGLLHRSLCGPPQCSASLGSESLITGAFGVPRAPPAKAVPTPPALTRSALPV